MTEHLVNTRSPQHGTESTVLCVNLGFKHRRRETQWFVLSQVPPLLLPTPRAPVGSELLRAHVQVVSPVLEMKSEAQKIKHWLSSC